MSDFIVDSEMRKKLNGLNETIRFQDEKGNPLGRFIPEESYMDLLYGWAGLEREDPADREKARKELREGGGYTTAEAIVFLEKKRRDARGEQ